MVSLKGFELGDYFQCDGRMSSICAGLPWLSLVLAQLIAARDWVRSNLLTLLHPINTLLSDLVLGIAPPKV